MRPRNKYEAEIVRMSEKLPALTAKQKQYAFENCFKHIGYRCKDSVWCTCCGGEFALAGGDVPPMLVSIEGKVTCPYCGRELEVEQSRKKKTGVMSNYAVLCCVRGDFQVIRQFYVEKSAIKPSQFPDNHWRKTEPIWTCITEVVQNWINLTTGKHTVIARPCVGMTSYEDNWDTNAPMSIKGNEWDSKYNYLQDVFIPGSRLSSKLRKLGLFLPAVEFSMPRLIKSLLFDNEAEILLKNGQFSILHEKLRRGWGPFGGDYWHAERIAIRNRYIVTDASMWLDYLRLLTRFGKDTHNAYYVCPASLKEAHDTYVRKAQREREKQDAERKRKQAMNNEAKYLKTHGMYFGVCFSDGKLSASVIQSVAEMAEEGSAMHHCVFECGYYNKKDSLILSVKDSEGNRVETVEVSLKTFEILQSRAKCNGTSPQHRQILNLVNKNMDLIRQIKEQHTTNQSKQQTINKQSA